VLHQRRCCCDHFPFSVVSSRSVPVLVSCCYRNALAVATERVNVISFFLGLWTFS
jgi:hypothetical protein